MAGDWDKAILAFSRCSKSHPAPTALLARSDPRSGLLIDAWRDAMRELDRRGASERDRLPYWDFAWQGYPFFSSDPTPDEPWFDFLDCMHTAARTRIRDEDPSGTDQRFALCRRLSALVRDANISGTMRLLREEWIRPHDDHHFCESAAFGCLRISDEGRRVFRTCFPESPLVGMIEAFDVSSAAEPPPSHPLARRWWALRTLLDSGGDTTPSVRDRSIAARLLETHGGPWTSPVVARTWELCGRWPLPDDPDLSSKECRDRIERDLIASMNETVDVGLACLYATTLLYRTAQDNPAEAEHRPYWKAWQSLSCGTVHLEWARLYLAHVESDGFPKCRSLTTGNREYLQDFERVFAGDVLGLFAGLLLAEDEIQLGRCDSARRRLERLYLYNPVENRRFRMAPAEGAFDQIRTRLMGYWYERDAARSFARGSRWPHETKFGEWSRGQVVEVQDPSVRQLVDTAEQLQRSGRTDAALRILRAELAEPAATLALAELLQANGGEDAVHAEVRALQDRSDLLREFQAGLELAQQGRAREFATRVASGLSAWTGEVPESVRVLFAAASTVPEFEPVLSALVTEEQSLPALVLAAFCTRSLLGTSLLLQAYLGRTPGLGHLPGISHLASFGLRRRGAEGLRAVVDESIRNGFNSWPQLQGLAAQFSTAEQVRGWSEILEHPEQDVRQFARERVDRIQRDDPWGSYCAKD